MAEEFSFLDFDNCNPEERDHLLTILHGPRDSPPVQSQPQDQEQQLQLEKPADKPEEPAAPVVTQVYNAQATAPYVYINNVTANVNVHHQLPTQQQKDQEPHALPPPQQPPPVVPPPTMAASHPPPPPQMMHHHIPFPGGFAAAPQAAKAVPQAMFYPQQLPFQIPQFSPVPAQQQQGQRPQFIRGQMLPPPNAAAAAAAQQQFNQLALLYQQQLIQQQFAAASMATPQAAAPAPVVVTQHQTLPPPLQPPPQPQPAPQPAPQAVTVAPSPRVVVDPEPSVLEKDHVVLEIEETEDKKEENEVENEEEEEEEEGIVFGTVDPATLESLLGQVQINEKTAEEDVSIEEEEAAEEAPKSWASLFKKDQALSGGSGGGVQPDSNNAKKPTAMIQPYNPNNKANQNIPGAQAKDKDNVSTKDMEMAEFLQQYALNHKASAIKPRGLSNRSNWCFVNAILQALVACPPFYNLMKSLPKDLLGVVEVDMKMLRAVHAFFSEFSPMEHFPKLNRKRKSEDLPQGPILEPSSIYNCLLNIDADTFKVIEGRQEDAEEFLTFLLNGLNDEMLALFKLVDEDDEEEEEDESDENDAEWQEVGPKNKSVITRRGGTAASGSKKPPLAEIFQGQMRSCLQHSNGEPTATLQPFFTLQLDIQSDKVRNVTEALTNNFALETIDGFLCSKTKQEVEASRSMSLEELPPILVLHLKRFVYDGSSKGCQKLLKNIDFPVDLEVGKDILSPNTKNKYPLKHRQYKLFAVVYHNGTEATKGHYITDIYHTGLATWIRCDDSMLKTMTESMVLAHSASSVPYILFYRRGDTMQGQSPKQ